MSRVDVQLFLRSLKAVRAALSQMKEPVPPKVYEELDAMEAVLARAGDLGENQSRPRAII